MKHIRFTAGGATLLNQRQIGPWATGIAAVLAAAGLGFGGYVAVATPNGVAAAAFVAVGVFFAIVALLGAVPKLKFGETEIDPTDAMRTGLALAAQRADESALTATAPEEVAADVRDLKEALDGSGLFSFHLRKYAEEQGIPDDEAGLVYSNANTEPWVPALSNELVAEAERLMEFWQEGDQNIFTQARENLRRKRAEERARRKQ